ncbi:bifunctional metallophosphatase/5'-nucleotidase [Arcanobacterium phocae]|uniref:bifunctional metallophosphatase/5'-nucleotidase n=1 Tax=Arcanobacterium phocae TaxID=131112 RepID=UPI001C102974|nr:bifunctional UDP-sugar hydrolase/5'-nucleotidase [Arcanobacterium phocae]
MRKHLSRPLCGASLAIALVLAPTSAWADETTNTASADSSDIVTLDLYNLTDIHGHIEKVAKTDKKTKQEKVSESGIPAVQCYLQDAYKTNPKSTLTLLGDNIGASPYTSGSQKDNPTIAALNQLPVIGSTIGNHELDLGQPVFKQRVDGSNTKEFVKVGFPYLGANVKGMGTYKVGDKDIPYLKDYAVTDLDGVKVAFIGAIAQDVPFKLSPDTTKGLTFEDPIAEMGRLAKELKASGEAQIVVAMLDDDVKNNYPKMPAEIDVLMGGDTHVPYEFDKVDSAVKLDSVNPLLAGISSGSYTDNLGLVRVEFDKKANKVVKADSILIPAQEVVEKSNPDCLENASAAKVVKAAQNAAKEAGKVEIVSGVKTQWNRGVFLEPGKEQPEPGSNRGVESTLGNLVADSILDQVTIDGTTPVDFGVVNAGGLRADLVPTNGVLTYADTYKALPFSNELGYAPMTGKQFKQALENQWKTNLNSQNSRPMLRLGTSSNLTYTYDATKPAGERITSILLNGQPMDMDKTYNVGSMTFVLQGGDGYFEKGLTVKTFGELDRDGFNKYLKKITGPKLTSATLKRGVGITLPTEVISEGADITIPLRGLSFTEGNGMTKQATVTVGTASQTVAVDNALLEPNAEKETSVITTDGAGQASATLPTAGICQAATGVVDMPVAVATDFGTVVTKEAGLTVKVDCGKNAQSDTAGKTPQDQKDGKKPGSDESKTSKLAKTGFASAQIAGLAALMLLAGGVLIGSKHRRSMN